MDGYSDTNAGRWIANYSDPASPWGQPFYIGNDSSSDHPKTVWEIAVYDDNGIMTDRGIHIGSTLGAFISAYPGAVPDPQVPAYVAAGTNGYLIAVSDDWDGGDAALITELRASIDANAMQPMVIAGACDG